MPNIPPSGLRGKQGFHDYYKQWFSDDAEFQSFLTSLEESTLPILRFSPANEKTLRALWDKAGIPWKTVDWYPYALLWPEGEQFGAVLPGYDEHLFYPMSASSLLPVLALELKGTERVLDACAAPGGKALCIADLLTAEGSLVANDMSPDRRERMKRVLSEYNHPEVDVWGMKAEVIFKKYPDSFDTILVDAPCSSEKHVYNHPHYIHQWSSGRVRQLKQRQIALLSGLFLALKLGGRMVYSTCAITPEENEDIVERLLKKKKDTIRLVPYALNTPGSDGLFPPEKHYSFDSHAVRRILPHRDHLDPMFVAIFERIA